MPMAVVKISLSLIKPFFEWTILIPPILHNPVSRRADGLLGDAHDAAHGLVVHAHFVEDEEEKLSLAVKSQKDFIPLHPQTD